jgi:hypothetical protein
MVNISRFSLLLIRYLGVRRRGISLLARGAETGTGLWRGWDWISVSAVTGGCLLNSDYGLCLKGNRGRDGEKQIRGGSAGRSMRLTGFLRRSERLCHSDPFQI